MTSCKNVDLPSLLHRHDHVVRLIDHLRVELLAGRQTPAQESSSMSPFKPPYSFRSSRLTQRRRFSLVSISRYFLRPSQFSPRSGIDSLKYVW